MSFLDQLLSKTLRRTRTVVTHLDGTRTLVTESGSEVALAPASGYVVDRSPDRVPALVAKNLYVGSQDCCDPETLAQFGIKSVLSVGVEAPLQAPAGVKYKFVECLDLPETLLPQLLDDCLPFIEAMVLGGGVLVHCNAGVSRSVTVIMGYLISRQGHDYESALKVVRAVRPSAKPNAGFERQLRLLRIQKPNESY